MSTKRIGVVGPKNLHDALVAQLPDGVEAQHFPSGMADLRHFLATLMEGSSLGEIAIVGLDAGRGEADLLDGALEVGVRPVVLLTESGGLSGEGTTLPKKSKVTTILGALSVFDPDPAPEPEPEPEPVVDREPPPDDEWVDDDGWEPEPEDRPAPAPDPAPAPAPEPDPVADPAPAAAVPPWTSADPTPEPTPEPDPVGNRLPPWAVADTPAPDPEPVPDPEPAPVEVVRSEPVAVDDPPRWTPSAPAPRPRPEPAAVDNEPGPGPVDLEPEAPATAGDPPPWMQSTPPVADPEPAPEAPAAAEPAVVEPADATPAPDSSPSMTVPPWDAPAAAPKPAPVADEPVSWEPDEPETPAPVTPDPQPAASGPAPWDTAAEPVSEPVAGDTGRELTDAELERLGVPAWTDPEWTNPDRPEPVPQPAPDPVPQASAPAPVAPQPEPSPAPPADAPAQATPAWGQTPAAPGWGSARPTEPVTDPDAAPSTWGTSASARPRPTAGVALPPRHGWRPPQPVNGKVLAVAAAKGGVGKTTVSIWLAQALGAALAANGQRAGLLDLNIGQFDIGPRLGVAGSPDLASLIGTQVDDHALDQALVNVPDTAITALCGPSGEMVRNADVANTLPAAKGALRLMKQRFPWTVIDTPAATLDHPVFNELVLRQADLLLMVVPGDVVAIRDCLAWLGNIEAPTTEGGLGFARNRTAVVLNMGGHHIGVTSDEVQSMLTSSSVSAQLLGEIPRMDEIVRNANAGRWAAPAEAIGELAQVLSTLTGVEPSAVGTPAPVDPMLDPQALNGEDPTANGGVLGRLMSRLRRG